MPGRSDERGITETPSPAHTAACTLTMLEPVKAIFHGRFSRRSDSSACSRSTQQGGQQRQRKHRAAWLLEFGAPPN